jgi:hypothetical protein
MRHFFLATALLFLFPRGTVAQTLPDCNPGGLLPVDGEVYICTAPNSFTKLVSTNIMNYGTTLPSTCLAGAIFTVTSGLGSFSYCNPNNTWNTLSAAASSVPAGMLTMILSGTCPAGWTESAALNGRMFRGTIAANGDVGTTAGADSITPAGTVAAPIFTGNSVASSAVTGGTPAGTIALGTLAVTAHTVVATKQGAAAGNVVTTATHALTGVPTFTGSALATHTHTTTATGALNAPLFTGTAFNNRPNYTNVIVCAKQ